MRIEGSECIMSKGYLLESDVEDLALNTLETVGYKVFKSPSSRGPNPEIDAARSNDHTAAILFDNLNQALRRINPGYQEEIYKDALRQIIRLADNPDMMINNHYFHKLLIEGIKVRTTLNGENHTNTLYPIDFEKFDEIGRASCRERV